MYNPKQYQTRVLAFVDVLGWSSLIRRSQSDSEVLAELDRVSASLSVSSWLGKEFFEKLSEDDMRDIRGGQFSDTFVISGPATPRSARAIIGAVLIVTDQIADLGHYVRGAVVTGALRHDDEGIFGPALLDAYCLEREVAKYPRVLVTDETDRLLKDVAGEERSWPFVRTDFDGLKYLSLVPHLDFIPSAVIEICRARRTTVRTRLRLDHADLKLTAKHNWMRRYLVITEREARRMLRATELSNRPLNPTDLRSSG
jgi:hypothetical protein